MQWQYNECYNTGACLFHGQQVRKVRVTTQIGLCQEWVKPKQQGTDLQRLLSKAAKGKRRRRGDKHHRHTMPCLQKSGRRKTCHSPTTFLLCIRTLLFEGLILQSRTGECDHQNFTQLYLQREIRLNIYSELTSHYHSCCALLTKTDGRLDFL